MDRADAIGIGMMRGTEFSLLHFFEGGVRSKSVTALSDLGRSTVFHKSKLSIRVDCGNIQLKREAWSWNQPKIYRTPYSHRCGTPE